MANDPSTTPGKIAEKLQPQRIPLAKIHDLPGTFISKPPDRTYGGLVSSIQAIGVTEPVILRQREDSEYQRSVNNSRSHTKNSILPYGKRPRGAFFIPTFQI